MSDYKETAALIMLYKSCPDESVKAYVLTLVPDLALFVEVPVGVKQEEERSKAVDEKEACKYRIHRWNINDSFPASYREVVCLSKEVVSFMQLFKSKFVQGDDWIYVIEEIEPNPHITYLSSFHSNPDFITPEIKDRFLAYLLKLEAEEKEQTANG